METVDKKEISMKYYVDCPECEVETEVEYIDIIGEETTCNECDCVFKLEGWASWE